MSTGVLPFVRGVDFSRNDFSGDRFPADVAQMTQMTWLKLNHAQLERVPDELSRLEKLEHLQMARNGLTNLHGELSDMPKLRSVIVRHNQIKTSGIPTDIFRMKDLTIIDFSHNSLREVPTNMEYAKGAIVLNLSHNNIETIPNQMFSNMIDLLFIDLSNNKLDMLPPQIRRLTSLRVLNLSNNPLNHFQLKQLPSLKTLRVLHMRNTHRTLDNIPYAFDDLDNLTELDFAENDLPAVPEAVYKLKNLRKLDLSLNKITELHIDENTWPDIETLNVSFNALKKLPDAIVKYSKLQKLYASGNQLTFDGLPSGLGKLLQLEVLHISYNALELIPEGLSRCAKLKRLRLDNNKLITLPIGIHLLPDLKELDLHNNDDLVMPPKPTEQQKKNAFYNVDFSLSHQLKLAGQSPCSSMSSVQSTSASGPRDSIQRRKDFIRRRRNQADESGASKVIQGLSKIATVKEAQDEMECLPGSKPLSWKDRMDQQPRLDYSDLFDEDVGTYEGMWVWEIENFYPSIMDEMFHGNFYEGDCYIILKTFKDEYGNPDHAIYYWIGEHSTRDKETCAALHSVNLRNHLGATCRTQREDMNDESEEFLNEFSEEIVYIEGARTQSGFYTVEKPVFTKRLYRATVKGSQVEMEPVPLSPESLDPRFVFLLDTGDVIWIWSGRRARITVNTKVRLFAEKLNKRDRKANAAIETCNELRPSEEFWIALTGKTTKPEEPIVEHVPLDFVPERRKLYQVQIGMGFLELPQVELPSNGVLKHEILNTKSVYVLDCTSDIFLWFGKKASRLLKMAGQKMVSELHQMLERPDYTTISRETEGEESTMFRSKFASWDEITFVDYTPKDTVKKQDLKVIMQKETKTDLLALFLDRQPAMPHEEADQILEECNEDLDLMEPFVLEGKKYVRLPNHELGIFYTMDCYVFLCRYSVGPESDEEYDDEASKSGGEDAEGSDAESKHSEAEEDFKCVVYFWQGRDASNMGWYYFTFALQKKFERLFKDKLEIVRMYQQQENHKFLSHFEKKFVIRRGRRGLTMNLGGKWPELFQLRANGSALCTRTIQIDCKAQELNSGFNHILRAPFRCVSDDGTLGRVFVWIGSKSDPYFESLVTKVAEELINRDENKFPVEVIREGEEPDLFWDYIGGKKKYDTDCEFMSHTRLFRCSNEKGFFSVSEKTVDFCQDDLDDTAMMMVDNGEILFLWPGSKCNEMVAKLSFKAAQVYISNLQMKQNGKPRKLMAVVKGLESKRFRKCFHAWGKHKLPAGDE
ncbi:hypothetical protein QR680_013613 [Steinernema hermaphroditum]|uniref:Gelsolin-like domain-containing protein n=1 Tax=Steinernema hermaphroditum TaxID=289476 RepID=A0AA39I8W6_9BILA|nr:hypothetical protein QR680_013613 [Steinernema hermaphroditum]